MKNIYKVLIFIALFVGLLSNVFGYNLKIKSEVNVSSETGEKNIVFRLTQKAHSSYISMYNRNQNLAVNGWIYKSSKTSHLFGLLGKENTYTNHEMLIYKVDSNNNPVTNFNYQARVDPYNVPVNFATCSKTINIANIPSISDFGTQLAYLNIKQGTGIPANTVRTSMKEGWEYRFKVIRRYIY